MTLSVGYKRSQSPFIIIVCYSRICETCVIDNPTNFLMVFSSYSRGIGHDEDAFEHKLLFMACCSDEFFGGFLIMTSNCGAACMIFRPSLHPFSKLREQLSNSDNNLKCEFYVIQ